MKRNSRRGSLGCRRLGFFERREQQILRIEPLENRSLLSAISIVDTPVAQPHLNTLANVTNPTPRGYTPSQIAAAYNFNNITFNGGTIKGDGSGQTIAIVNAYNHPNIVADLHTFDVTFGLPDPPSFKVLNQNGGSALPATDAGWSQEIALDVEWAHAMAPGASIVLVEANSASISDLITAVNTARNLPGVSVVSMSWGSSEFFGETQFDQYFTTPRGHTGVTFVAAAGDSGAQATWPAISPNVLSVGGTSLSASSRGYGGESAWSGSGGGISRFESEPSFQRGVQNTGARTSPDVSYDADPNTGFAVYSTVSIGGRSGWFEIGGTSAGAPQWAALLAIANQGRALAGSATLAGAQSTIYSLPSGDFHDITSGSNGYSARAGYDLVTGRGTPIASAVVHDLVGNSRVSPAPTTTSGSSSSSSSSNSAATPTPTQPSQGTRYELIYWRHHWWLIPIGLANAMDAGDKTDQSNAITFQEVTQGVTNTSLAVTSSAPTQGGASLGTISYGSNSSLPTVSGNLLVATQADSYAGRVALHSQLGDATSSDDAPPTFADDSDNEGPAAETDSATTGATVDDSGSPLSVTAKSLDASALLAPDLVDAVAWELGLPAAVAGEPMAAVSLVIAEFGETLGELFAADDRALTTSWELDLAMAAVGLTLAANHAQRDRLTVDFGDRLVRYQLLQIENN